METFDFPYHRVSTTNPESGTRVQLGQSYVFAAPPTSPDQRIFNLSFETMKYFTDEFGGLDENIAPQLNMLTLTRFYQEHKLHKSFLYPHPVHGTVVVKFSKPLVEPMGRPGGTGATESFEIELIEMP